MNKGQVRLLTSDLLTSLTPSITKGTDGNEVQNLKNDHSPARLPPDSCLTTWGSSQPSPERSTAASTRDADGDLECCCRA